MNAQQLQTELASLLHEESSRVRDWESAEFDRLVQAANPPLVVFGAGGLGQKTLHGLRQMQIEPLAFADNSAAMQGTALEGLPVLSPGEALTRFGEDAVFVIAIWSGWSPDSMGDKIAFLHGLGCKKVSTFYPLYCKYAGMFLPHYACDLPHRVHKQADAVFAAGALWSDSISRREYLGQVKWRATMDFAAFLPPVQHETYFPHDLCALKPDEVFVDCGAFDGDTLRSFLAVSKQTFRQIYAFEPDPQNYLQLGEWVQAQPKEIAQKIRIDQLATSAQNETLRFSADGTAASALGETGSIKVKAVSLDSYFADIPISYLKMDIEGAELDTIRGASAVIRRDRPVLAICVYHQQDHIWTIPNEMNEICEDYQFYLRPHLPEGWDTVAYAIPRERAIQPPQ